MLIAAAATLALLGCKNAPVPQESAASAPPKDSIYQFTMNDIDGKPVPLQKYNGKVLLVVNVASKCGFTPQYAGLQSLYKEYHDKGFEVLGFPANDFKSQEPGTNEEIKQFCTANYNVTFPMFSKITVLGDDANPLYKWLIANADRHEPIEWNFCKFLIDKQGHVIARWASKTTPQSEELTGALEKALQS